MNKYVPFLAVALSCLCLPAFADENEAVTTAEVTVNDEGSNCDSQDPAPQQQETSQGGGGCGCGKPKS